MAQEAAIVPGIDFLYTNIGRGHPFYLDGIREALSRDHSAGLPVRAETVFDISRGMSALGWRAVRRVYVLGASGGLTGALYDRLRHGTDYNRPSALLGVLGHDIRRRHVGGRQPLVIAHPILVGILRGRDQLLYQHGELVVPEEARVSGASIVFVPTEEAAGSFLRLGYERNQVLVTGLCIEPSLVAQAQTAWELRHRRIQGGGMPTGLFFSSGAEPREHIARLCLAAVSVLRSGGRVIVLARRGGGLERRIRRLSAVERLPLVMIGPKDGLPPETSPLLLATFGDRHEQDVQTARLFPQTDYVAGPPHERSNWALGLGLPLFAVTPTIGSFAPLNLRLLADAGVAEELGEPDDCRRFGERLLARVSDGTLSRMATSGWGQHRIDGFATIASWLADRYGLS